MKQNMHAMRLSLAILSSLAVFISIFPVGANAATNDGVIVNYGCTPDYHLEGTDCVPNDNQPPGGTGGHASGTPDGGDGGGYGGGPGSGGGGIDESPEQWIRELLCNQRADEQELSCLQQEKDKFVAECRSSWGQWSLGFMRCLQSSAREAEDLCSEFADEVYLMCVARD